jgi:hypothetical protein
LMEKTVIVCASGKSVQAVLEWDERPPYRVVLRIPGIESAEASGKDLFECLAGAREQVARSGWTPCLVGARIDAWPSRMSSQMSGGSLVYVHTMGRQAREGDLRDIFDDAPCDAVGSVEQQHEFRTRWFESLSNAT